MIGETNCRGTKALPPTFPLPNKDITSKPSLLSEKSKWEEEEKEDTPLEPTLT